MPRTLKDPGESQLEKERDRYWGRWPEEPDDYEDQLKIDKAVEEYNEDYKQI